MKWIRVKEGHKWLDYNDIGVVASIDMDGTMEWYCRNGKRWEGDKRHGIVESWFPIGFIECTEEQAKELLKK